jgi:xanthine dehydrogenase small subunit
MRDRIRFFLNGILTEAGGEDVFLTLAEYLRRRRGLTGTKIVCAEGDCGSCAVLIGRADGERVDYRAVTSCIQILFQLDAAHVITVEGLRDGVQLNPIQRAMVSCHGTQCGFCTPGFVVALQSVMDDGQPVEAEKVRRGLTGNLCRCTGYESIIQAALRTDRKNLKSIDQLYPPGEILNKLNELAGEEVRIETAARLFYKPISIQQAAQFRLDHPACSVIAGATDLGVVYNKKLREIDIALSLSGIASLKQIVVEPDAIHIGAGVTLSDFQSLATQHIPELGRFMEWFGSPLIRSAGTLGGNIVTGSPIGDTIPALMVLQAELELTSLSTARVVPISQFYTGYRKTVLDTDEFLTSIRIGFLKANQLLKLYKVSRRRDLDISTFSAAIFVEQSGGALSEIRIAFGGVGPMVMRLAKTEAVLRGFAPTLGLFQQAGKIAREEVTHITDVRGSAGFRQTLAENILSKFWHEVFGNSAIDQSRVLSNANGVS